MSESKSTQNSEGRMGLGEHLNELRAHLIRSIIYIFTAFILCFCLKDGLMYIVSQPIISVMEDLRMIPKMMELRPGEYFITMLKVCLYCSMVLVSPLLFFELWRFISVGLFPHERRYVYFFIPFSAILFLAGVCFAYFGAIPYGMYFLIQVTPDFVETQYSVAAYVASCLSMTIAFAIVFQMPLMMMMLSKIGVIKWQLFARYRRQSYFGTFVIAAVVTPPDPFTQVMMAFPMIILYEFGIQLSRLNITKLIGADKRPAQESDSEGES